MNPETLGSRKNDDTEAKAKAYEPQTASRCCKIGSPATQLLATGLQLHQAGRLVAAEACYREVLATQPNHAAAHSNLGNALAMQRKLDEAVASFRQAISIKPDFADAHSNLGSALTL